MHDVRHAIKNPNNTRMPTTFMTGSHLTLDPSRTCRRDKNAHLRFHLRYWDFQRPFLLGPSSRLRGQKSKNVKTKPNTLNAIKTNSNSNSPLHTLQERITYEPPRGEVGGWAFPGVCNLGPRHLNQPPHATSSIHLTPPWQPLWPCCPCALSLSPGRASPSSPKTISILRALCRAWSLLALCTHRFSSHHDAPLKTIVVAGRAPFLAEQEDQSSYGCELQCWFQPSRVRYPFLKDFFLKKIKCFGLLKLGDRGKVHFSSDDSYSDGRWILWFLSFISILVFLCEHKKMHQSSVDSTTECSASLLVVHHFGFSRNNSRPECELQCWLQSSWVWFLFLRDFFLQVLWLAHQIWRLRRTPVSKWWLIQWLALDSLTIEIYPHSDINLWAQEMH